MKIQKADSLDIAQVGRLYDSVCDYLSSTVNYPGWKKGLYPTAEDAASAIAEGSLYIAVLESRVIGAVTLRNKPEHGYEQANWSIDLTYDKVFVVYTLAVLPQLMNRGVASDLLRFAEDTARKSGMKAIRLDVVANNIPAIRLYEKLGFMCVGDFDLGYGKYGLDLFKLYEKNL